jgi:hypothetical protein
MICPRASLTGIRKTSLMIASIKTANRPNSYALSRAAHSVPVIKQRLQRAAFAA